MLPTTGLRTFLHDIYVPQHLGLSEGHVDQLAIAVKLFDRWHGSPVLLCDLSDDFVLRFLSDYLKTHSASTTNSKRCAVLALWRHAWKRGLVQDPPRDVPRAPVDLPLPEAWKQTEVERIVATTRVLPGLIYGTTLPAKDWWSSLVCCLYDSGARVGALLRVTCADFSLSDRYLILRTTKTRRAKWVSLSEMAVTAVAAIHDPHRELLWPWHRRRECLGATFRRILRDAGVRYGRGAGGVFHKLRRTSGSLVEANGGDGSRHLGNTRDCFEKHYCDPRIARHSQQQFLPSLRVE